MNPAALAFWALLGIIGYLVAGGTGALVAVAMGLAISLLAESV